MMMLLMVVIMMMIMMMMMMMMTTMPIIITISILIWHHVSTLNSMLNTQMNLTNSQYAAQLKIYHCI